ncbi:MAG: hypothetical protein GYA36_17390 [Veillonellaceae bacterium]|nr:hypothetical protein [Veillonellaceae bacterium]
MTLLDSLGRLFFRRTAERLDEIAESLYDAYVNRPVMLPIGQSKLTEDDPYYDLMIRLQQARDGLPDFNNAAVRVACVRDSRNLYAWDVITRAIISLWTNYGFGTKVDVTPDDPAAVDGWTEFWTAPRNQYILGERNIHALSDNLLVDGELVMVFFVSTLDGTATLRVINPLEITEVICDPADSTVPVYYKRQYTSSDGVVPATLYYRDWRATDDTAARVQLPPDAKRAEYEMPHTDVRVLFVTHQPRGQRGWPLMTAAAPWTRAYRSFVQDRAAVAKAVSTFVNKLKLKGSSRSLDDAKLRLQSALAAANSLRGETNPVPPAGSMWLENEGASVERMPLATGASDAEKDGISLLAMAGLGGMVYPHYLGLGGSTYRLATATAMERPMEMSFNRYQLFWVSVWEDVGRIVLDNLVRYGHQSYATTTVKVSTEAIIRLDPTKVTAITAAVVDLVKEGIMDVAVAEKVSGELIQTALQTIGLSGDVYDSAVDDASQSGEMAEAIDSVSSYFQALRAPCYGLWSGKISYAECYDMLMDVIRIGLTKAWHVGIAKLGMKPQDMTVEETNALTSCIYNEYARVDSMLDWIEDNRRGVSPWSSIQPRIQLWANRYNDVVNQALLMAKQDPPLEWMLGETEQHCTTCLYLNGKVKRRSYWEKSGYTPQNPPNAMLECGGWRCQCHFEPVDKPLSRGRLKGENTEPLAQK